MIAQAAVTSPREVEPAKSAGPAPAVRTTEKRETEDPAVVIAVGNASTSPFESYRANSLASGVGRAAEEFAQDWSPASTATRVAQVSPAPAPPAPQPVAAAPDEARSGARPGLGHAPGPSGPSPAELASLPARPGQRTASMDPASANFNQPARPSAPPPAPPALPSPIAIEAPPSAAGEVVKAATAKPPDAEGPPNRQVSTVQVELAGAAAQSAQPASQLEPKKKSAASEHDVSRGEHAKAVEKVQANARHVGAIKDMMEYTRYEQDRWKGLAKSVARPAADGKKG
jgi:hypothetical protein